MSKLLPKFNFQEWIDDNRHLLKPPVGNKAVWQNQDYIVMVVGGPNSRKDYHVNHTPEFFYQVEGGITLRVIDEGETKDINIAEGEIYLLPAGIPHSPRRGPNTIGLVIEQRRPEGMEDALVYFCENCGTKMYEEAFTLQNIETDLPKIFDKFFGSKHATCPSCGTEMVKPK